MTVRSAQLANVTSAVAGAYTTIYTCPTGARTIVKDVRILSGATAPGVIFVSVKSGTPVTAILVVLAAATAQLYTLSGGFVVMNAGDLLQVYVQSTTGGNWNCIASGAELQV